MKSVEYGKDGLVRRAVISYKNNTENVFRETHRSARSIVVIHHVDETNLVKELGEIANSSDIRLRMELEK